MVVIGESRPPFSFGPSPDTTQLAVLHVLDVERGSLALPPGPSPESVRGPLGACGAQPWRCGVRRADRVYGPPASAGRVRFPHRHEPRCDQSGMVATATRTILESLDRIPNKDFG